jgi:hypothetical protein
MQAGIVIKYLKLPHIDHLVNDTEQNFFDKEEPRLLRVSIRIANEFYQFLLTQQGGNFPSFIQAEYEIGTIRSGMDSFLDMRYAAQLVQMDPIREPIKAQLQSFPEFKIVYNSHIQRMTDPEISFYDFYCSLIILWKLQIVFVGLVI